MAGASSADAGTPARFRDIAIVGGGCYGTFYATQLERARERGRIAYRRIMVVDRNPECSVTVGLREAADLELVVADWGKFFDDWLGTAAGTGDAIVPSPLMPHLMYEWIVRRARARWPRRRVEQLPVAAEAGTPYDMLVPDGTRFVSYADWLCPTHCIEPALCPATRAPRTWEMTEALEAMTRRLSRGEPVAPPVVFRCRHRVHGVGMFDVDEVLAGDAAVVHAGGPGGPVSLLVGTVSSCHGAISLLHLGADG